MVTDTDVTDTDATPETTMAMTPAILLSVGANNYFNERQCACAHLKYARVLSWECATRLTA